MNNQRSHPNLTEKRRDLRYGVTGMPNARLSQANGDEIIFFFVDASCHGLGIVIDKPMTTGETVQLRINDTDNYDIKLEVRWTAAIEQLTQPIGASPTLYRCGLLACDPNIDLVVVLSKCQNISLEALV